MCTLQYPWPSGMLFGLEHRTSTECLKKTDNMVRISRFKITTHEILILIKLLSLERVVPRYKLHWYKRNFVFGYKPWEPHVYIITIITIITIIIIVLCRCTTYLLKKSCATIIIVKTITTCRSLYDRVSVWWIVPVRAPERCMLSLVVACISSL